MPKCESKGKKSIDVSEGRIPCRMYSVFCLFGYLGATCKRRQGTIGYYFSGLGLFFLVFFFFL